MGYGRKVEDLEPGRCRRTDGKKWRCSKEAHPDSKYCERHMHRGKNRSRKPVETLLAAAPAGRNREEESSASGYVPTLYPRTQNHPAFPYSFGMRKEVVDQYKCSSDSRASVIAERNRDGSGSWTFTPLGMGLSEPNNNNKPPLLFPKPVDDVCHNGEDQQKKRRQGPYCFVLSDDFKLQTPEDEDGGEGYGVEEVKKEESQKPLGCFFGDWLLKKKEPSPSPSSWIDLEEDRSFSKTQLSMSTPRSHFSP